MATIQRYTTREAAPELVDGASLGTLQAPEAGLLWIDIPDPTPVNLAELGKVFGFHPLALEDALRARQRPKVDTYEDYLFITFYAVTLAEAPVPDDPVAGVADPLPVAVDARMISIFVGKHYVVTVHHGPLACVEDTLRRWALPLTGMDRTSSHLLYSLLDSMVDDYFPIIDEVSEQVDALEEEIFEHYDTESLERIFDLKKELLGMRRIVGPERDVLNVLLRRESPVIDPASAIYFQDVYDHILRVLDAIDTYRDMLSSALDAHLSIASNRLNQVMKTLTASSIVLMTVTLVASIYGMNFVNMPELSWPYGYAWALGLMATLAIGLIVIFRKIDWI